MNIKDTAKEVLLAVIPIVVIVIILNFTLVRLPSEDFFNFIGGAFLVSLGFILFLTGIKLGFLPLGEMIGSKLVSKGKLWLMLLVGFVLGFAVTFAEPDVQVLAMQVDMVSGEINKNVIITAISLGVGVFLALAVLRIFLQIKIEYLLMGGYTLIFILGFITSPDFLAISFDAGGVTTGPMTVPFILSFGVGVGSVPSENKDSDNSFGLVALSSMGPIIAVMLLGIIYS